GPEQALAGPGVACAGQPAVRRHRRGGTPEPGGRPPDGRRPPARLHRRRRGHRALQPRARVV
ncbi:MAG: hypothetical protein AVDCRST_MAG03-32, partial [uncultured Rubrobacteraceae bacterium]